MPITVGGEVVGAVGVSGATSADEDQELALVGVRAAEAAAAAPRTEDASYFPADAVRARFAEGGLLLDAAAYKIDAGRRAEPGEVELHEHAVDVMHVVQGSAAVLTGGAMRDAREVGPGELRAPAVDGATRHELSEGDVLAIPQGVPHQFVEVSDPFLYFVVKVAA
jgi:glc operon protein GlcG